MIYFQSFTLALSAQVSLKVSFSHSPMIYFQGFTLALSTQAEFNSFVFPFTDDLLSRFYPCPFCTSKLESFVFPFTDDLLSRFCPCPFYTSGI